MRGRRSLVPRRPLAVLDHDATDEGMRDAAGRWVERDRPVDHARHVLDLRQALLDRFAIGAELPHIFAVSHGLQKDDKILLEGLRQVRENQKISYKFQKPDSVISHLSLYAE